MATRPTPRKTRNAPGTAILYAAINATVYRAFRKHIGQGVRLNYAVEQALLAAMQPSAKRVPSRTRQLMP